MYGVNRREADLSSFDPTTPYSKLLKRSPTRKALAMTVKLGLTLA
ncbi:MAG TPA: hypothetical protein V6D15_00925 [Oculatellaceae cyanobacterium]